MKSIGGFFEKFNNKFAKEVHNLVFVVEILKKHTGITFEAKDVQISRGIIRIKAGSVQKNEIFVKKSRILKDLEGGLRGIKVHDIQ